jgi:hypothetical protein
LVRRRPVHAALLATLLTRAAAAQGPAPAPASAPPPAPRAAAADGASPAREPTEAELEAARALFEAARKDEAAKRWGEAHGKFRRILPTKDTASLRFHLAYCEENMGLLASAVGNYRRAAELAQATKGPDRKLIVEDSAKSIAELTPRVPAVTLELPAGVEGVGVSVDGEDVSPERLRAPLPLDPGHHMIEVTVRGKRAFRREVRLGERESPAIAVAFEPAVEFAPPSAPAKPAPGPRRPSPERSASAAGGGVPLGAWVSAGAGAAFGGVAAGFLSTSLSQRRDLNECEAAGKKCQGGPELASSANRNMTIAAAAGGLALAGAGAAVWFALGAPSKGAGKAPAVGLGLSPTGVAWRGTFLGRSWRARRAGPPPPGRARRKGGGRAYPDTRRGLTGRRVFVKIDALMFARGGPYPRLQGTCSGARPGGTRPFARPTWERSR